MMGHLAHASNRHGLQHAGALLKAIILILIAVDVPQRLAASCVTALTQVVSYSEASKKVPNKVQASLFRTFGDDMGTLLSLALNAKCIGTSGISTFKLTRTDHY